LAGRDFESTGRILAVDYDGEQKRLMVATSQSISYYTLSDSAVPVIQGNAAIATCNAPANTEIRDFLFFRRDFVNRLGTVVPTYIVALGLATKGGNEGEVQFFDVSGTSKVTQCATSKVETPNAVALTTNGAVTKLVKATDISSPLLIKTVPDQPTFVLATAFDGRVYPFRIGIRESDPNKLLAQFAPNNEGLNTPFLPVQPIQRGPVVDSGTPDANKPENTSIFVYYVSDSLYCRRFLPLKEAASEQVTECSINPSASSIP
jgi:hypothetical protein